MHPQEPKTQISRHLIEELIQLESRQNDYMPGAAIATQLAEKSLLLIVAPTSMGKSTVIRRVTEIDDRFGIVGSFTTRDPRADENGKQFTYIPHTDAGLEHLFKRIRQQELVQYIIHPTTKHIYGTDISHYPKPYNLLDFIYNSIDGIRKLPFKESPVISIATEPSQWAYWFNQRFPEGNPERHKRLDEAIMCFRWLLAQPIPAVHWVVNGEGMLDQAAGEVVRIGLGSHASDLAGRRYAELCLAEALRMK
jgi:guanylate kinase